MKFYKVVIEAVFITLPGNEMKGSYGLFSTFYVSANNGKNAVHRVGRLMSDRIRAHGIQERHEGLFRTRWLVHELWTVDEKNDHDEGRDTGFTFFRIGLANTVIALVRFAFIRRFKAHLLFNPESK